MRDVLADLLQRHGSAPSLPSFLSSSDRPQCTDAAGLWRTAWSSGGNPVRSVDLAAKTPGVKTLNTHAGSCLCAAVRFEVTGDFERFYLCHCGYCRKDTGSAHAANLFSGTAALKWLSGQDKVTQFTLPSTRHGRSFCSICGSALPSLQMNGALLVVPAGSLDGEVPIRPDAHIFSSGRAIWDRALEDVPCMAGLPQ